MKMLICILSIMLSFNCFAVETYHEYAHGDGQVKALIDAVGGADPRLMNMILEKSVIRAEQDVSLDNLELLESNIISEIYKACRTAKLECEVLYVFANL